MIVYDTGTVGVVVGLTRFHGSAAYKVVLPALISTVFLYGLYELYDRDMESILRNPYPIGSFVVFFR